MFTDQFKHEINSYLKRQGDRLLETQRGIAQATYRTRTGQLMNSLSGGVTVSDCKVDIPYPVHIRFLDMKKTRTGKKKKRYFPIYNKYVYGYLKSDIWRMLNAAIPKQMIRIIEGIIKTVK